MDIHSIIEIFLKIEKTVYFYTFGTKCVSFIHYIILILKSTYIEININNTCTTDTFNKNKK